MKDILSRINEIRNSGKIAALCIIINTKGSSPRKTGTKMIVYKDGSIEGTIGGGSLELKVIEDAIKTLEQNIPQKFSYELMEDLSMHCGGFAEVYIEPILQQNQLYIFGAGHIGKVLTRFAHDFGFQVTLIDPRENMFQVEFPENVNFIKKDFVEAAEMLELASNAYVVIVTPQHKNDEAVLAVVANKPHTYIGMIGSKTKVALARKRFTEEGILTSEILDGIDMPIGIKFNAQTPEEIALSILAKMIDVKNSIQ